MHIRKIRLFILFISIISFQLSAQVSVRDSSIYTPFVGVSYGGELSGGDLAKRYGGNFDIGMCINFKLKNYWIIGINGSYFFGKTIKENIFANIASPDGSIVNRDGEFADVRLYERGFTVLATAGRMITFNKKPNPNSGLTFDIGVGFMQHKIRIETIGNNVPQLSKQYKKGYDRLSNGLLLSQDLGYLYLSNNRLLNFYFGLECMEGFTQSRRSFDYDLMKKDTQKRLDILYGAKIAWILPLYKKAPQEFYTY
jgi:hypothetical protein